MKNLFGKIKRRRPKLSIGMWLLFSFVIITFAVLWLLRGVLFQEPISIAISTASLEISGNDWITDGSGHRSIIKTNAFQKYLKYLADEGWEYFDRMGAGYLFKKVDESATLSCHQYSRRYRICSEGLLNKTD